MLSNKYLTLIQLLRNERRPVEELADLQNRKLRRLIRHVYDRVPFYRQRFDQVGVQPEDIRTVADLAKLPIISKQDVIDAPHDEVLDTSVPKSSLVARQTSGSTGMPFRFYVDQNYDQFCKALFLRPYFSTGRRIFDVAMRFTPVTAAPKKWFQRLGILREYRVPCNASGEEMLAVYRRVTPDVLIGYPSAISVLAETLVASGDEVHLPRIVFTDSEVLTDFTKDRIRAAFRTPIIDVYGTLETDNIAWQCRDGSAYHYAADCVILETVQDGQSVGPDEPGELVCTVLNSLTMPFVRYNMGDIVTLSSGGCDCGRTLPLISTIEGRAMDRLTLPDGSRVSAAHILHEFKLLGDVVREFQVVQETVDDFTVNVSLRHNLSDVERVRITNTIHPTNPQARVTIRSVDSERRRPSAKKRLFVSRVQKQ